MKSLKFNKASPKGIDHEESIGEARFELNCMIFISDGVKGVKFKKISMGLNLNVGVVRSARFDMKIDA